MNRRAFTLIELLVVVAIIAILAAIIFPVFATARSNARRTTCISNLRQIGMGLHMYRQDCGEFPLYLSLVNRGYVEDRRIFKCPADPLEGIRPGNPRIEGTLYMPSGVSYDYVPQWDTAIQLGWWQPGPSFGQGKWDDLTPLADCQWHWANSFSTSWSKNQATARGWQLVLTSGIAVRKIRVEDPVETFTPERYR